MELWIKDLKCLHGDRMSCGKFKANPFRLFLYAAAYVMLYQLKYKAFEGTEIASFTMDSFLKKIMLSAVLITEQKCAIKVSFAPHHRYRAEITKFLSTIAA
ncbi:transposase [Bacteroides heparinolyticus]|uniref:transposase n=1 Tax=Prevotella heparinolytica TaxID=28113 RepID=UPI0039909130